MRIKINNKSVYLYTGTKELVSDQDSIVFIHGAGLDHTVWLLQSRYFAHHGWNVIAVDLPGHGHSEGPTLLNIEIMADWVVELLEVLNLRRVTIVGHSMGSLVALQVGSTAPTRITRLGLLGTSAPMPVNDGLLNAAKANKHDAFDMISLWGHSRSAHVGGNPVPGMWMPGNTIRLLERSHPGVLYQDLSACNTYQNGSISARKILCPVLVVCAKQDRMTPIANTQLLIDELKDVRAITIDQCGHQMLSEQPERVLDALIEFVFERRQSESLSSSRSS